jgi:hypothetical protein
VSVLIVGSMAVDTVEFEGTGERHELVGGSATFAALSAGLFTDVRMVGVVGRDFPLHPRPPALPAGRPRGRADRRRRDLSLARPLRRRPLVARVARHPLNVFEHFRPTLPDSYRKSSHRAARQHPPHPPGRGARPGREARARRRRHHELLDPRHPQRAARPAAPPRPPDHQRGGGPRPLGPPPDRPRRPGAPALGPEHGGREAGRVRRLPLRPHGAFHAPAYPVEQVVDPTGAGDTFAGAMLGYLDAQPQINGATLRRAVVYGSAVASIAWSTTAPRGSPAWATTTSGPAWPPFIASCTPKPEASHCGTLPAR